MSKSTKFVHKLRTLLRSHQPLHTTFILDIWRLEKQKYGIKINSPSQTPLVQVLSLGIEEVMFCM